MCLHFNSNLFPFSLFYCATNHNTSFACPSIYHFNIFFFFFDSGTHTQFPIYVHAVTNLILYIIHMIVYKMCTNKHKARERMNNNKIFAIEGIRNLITRMMRVNYKLPLRYVVIAPAHQKKRQRNMNKKK